MIDTDTRCIHHSHQQADNQCQQDNAERICVFLLSICHYRTLTTLFFFYCDIPENFEVLELVLKFSGYGFINL